MGMGLWPYLNYTESETQRPMDGFLVLFKICECNEFVNWRFFNNDRGIYLKLNTIYNLLSLNYNLVGNKFIF